jgi:hypothetical protein
MTKRHLAPPPEKPPVKSVWRHLPTLLYVVSLGVAVYLVF